MLVPDVGEDAKRVTQDGQLVLPCFFVCRPPLPQCCRGMSPAQRRRALALERATGTAQCLRVSTGICRALVTVARPLPSLGGFSAPSPQPNAPSPGNGQPRGLPWRKDRQVHRSQTHPRPRPGARSTAGKQQQGNHNWPSRKTSVSAKPPVPSTRRIALQALTDREARQS